MPGVPGGGEILTILVVALVVFGPHRLPELARQFGSIMGKLRSMQDTVKREIQDAVKFDPNFADPAARATSAAPSYADYGLDEPIPQPLPSMPGHGYEPIEPPSSGFN